MKSVDLMYQTMLAELGQRSLDGAWTADFPPEGRFTPAKIKGRNISAEELVPTVALLHNSSSFCCQCGLRDLDG
jgi:hypothetical protein